MDEKRDIKSDMKTGIFALTRYMTSSLFGIAFCLTPVGVSEAVSGNAEQVEWADLQSQPVPAADHRMAWGKGPEQFGELRLPGGEGPHPVAVIIHGGCWRNAFNLDHTAHLASALNDAGVATWSLEYRRLGDDGGGWPGTFRDVVAGFEYLSRIADRFDLDLDRVVAVGHSAGGHLALWLAGRHRQPAREWFENKSSLELSGVVALAPIANLAEYAAGSGSCNRAAIELMEGGPDELPDRYALADPIRRLPVGVPVMLVHGQADPIVPPAQSAVFAEKANAAGDEVELIRIDGAGHFDLIAPFSPFWPRVESALRWMWADPD